MATVEIYTSPMCGFCWRAKALLEQEGVAFTEYDVFEVPGAREEMLNRANGRRTVPQIFIDGHGIGGSDELAQLHATGKLAELLGASA
jgi:glutaredoxin 3